MSVDIVVAIVSLMCPNLEKMGYYLDAEEVTCMEYYTNDIVNYPDRYEEFLKDVKSE